ncbi:phosphate uptake regulator PhoU [Candidatus Woesearchaeota archaeon]|nr:phosphate uptake regulator PhoU [Candidatus Woesearchaeota archaeon]
MEARRLQKVGNRSYAVCLPKKWVIGNKIKEQDHVFMDINKNNELVLKAKQQEAAIKETITVDISDIDNLPEFLVLCYVKNVDKIILRSKKLDYEKFKALKKVISYLDGYEISEEDENHVVIQFLFKDVNITLIHLLRRMTYLLSVMVTALENNDLETLQKTETTTDQLYHLSKRIMHSCMKNSKQREENDIKSEEDILFMNIIFKKLENIGDRFESLTEKKLSESDYRLLKEMINLLNDLFFKKNELKSFKEKLSKIKKSANSSAIRGSLLSIADLCLDIFENVVSIEYGREYFK